MDLATLVNGLMEDGTVSTLAINPQAQFGIAPRRYLGAELLPERTVDENAYRETSIRYRTVVANDGTRYSPTQKKGNVIVGDFLVDLGESDIASEFTGRDYDALMKLLRNDASMEASVALARWMDQTVNLPLVEKNEVHRWAAIVNAVVQRRGDNSYQEDVAYSNPAGHRANAAGTWSSDAYDPFDDIHAMNDLAASKGYTISRIITARPVLAIMAGNDKVKARVGVSVVNSSGQITSAAGRASRDAINAALERDGLPPIETYDLQYRTQTGSGFFLPRNAMVLVATTGRDETIDLGDADNLTMNDTLGYTAIGRATGQQNGGRVLRMEAKEDKPPRVEAEGWQTSLPVITEPEAIYVIKSIA